LVIKVSSEPAENTKTSPVGLAVAGAELAGAEADVVELEEELLQPAASAVQVMAARARTGALFLVTRGIIPRTLPLLVARRKEPRHPVRGWL
jgi:hypothetical protein